MSASSVTIRSGALEESSRMATSCLIFVIGDYLTA
jgi:hypothetical protein